jgi:L-alanine-DL-glutamate epimerase-like enolase superfamily enzyme
MHFHHPLKVAIGVTEAVSNVVIKMTTDTGLIGWGEASPCCPYITGDLQATAYATGEHLARLVVGKNPLAIENRMTEINRYMVGEPSIRGAFDMAFYDIAAKVANMPLYQFLGGEQREIRTDLTIGWQDTIE